MEIEEFIRALKDNDFSECDTFWIDGIEFEVLKNRGFNKGNLEELRGDGVFNNKK